MGNSTIFPRRVGVVLALACVGCSGRPLELVLSPPTDDGGTAPTTPQPRPETCNGVDDDLDGRVDEGCPIRLTTDGADDLSPEVRGSRVAWVRAGALYLKELPEGPERKIADGVAPGFAFDGTRVVSLSGNDHFVLIDVDTQQETLILPVNLYGELGAPSFAGRRVVWQQHIPQSWAWDESEDIYVYDPDTRTIAPVTDSHVMRTDALGDGAQVVWGDGTRFHDWINYNSYYDLYVADLEQNGGGRAIAVGGDTISTVPVALRKGRVLAYEEQMYGADAGFIGGTNTCQLLLYDVASGQRTELEPAQPVDGTQCDATQPGFITAFTFNGHKPEAFDGDRLVRELHPLDESDLYLYDLASGAQYRLTDHPRRSQRPRLDGNILVWQDDRNDQFDIYMMDLTDVAAGGVFPKGNPRNHDCDGGDRGGCVARVGRAYALPAPQMVGRQIVYAGHDGVTRFDVDARQAQTLAPILDASFTKIHAPQYVEVAAAGEIVAWVRDDRPTGNVGYDTRTLFVQRHAGATPEPLTTTGFSIDVDQGRVAWLVYDTTAKKTTLMLDSDGQRTATTLMEDPAVTLSNLSVSGDWAVCQTRTTTGMAPDELAIIAINLRTGEVRHPADGLPTGGRDGVAKIDGNTIAWSHVPPGTGYGSLLARVYTYDVTSGARTELSRMMTSEPTAIDVAGPRVCWDDGAGGVWLYNATSGQMKRMTGRGHGCAIGDGVIAFFEGSDVYERRLDATDP